MKTPIWYTWKPTAFCFISAILITVSQRPSNSPDWVNMLGGAFVLGGLGLAATWLVGGFLWRRNQAVNDFRGGTGVQASTLNPKLKTCKACGAVLSKTALKCPSCGEKNTTTGQAVFAIAALAGVFWFYFGGGAKQQVADDFVAQYYLAVKGGDRTQMCVHAGLVVAAYSQAHDQDKYLEWLRTQKTDCGR